MKRTNETIWKGRKVKRFSMGWVVISLQDATERCGLRAANQSGKEDPLVARGFLSFPVIPGLTPQKQRKSPKPLGAFFTRP
jgi:hypothetical protein